MTSVGFFDPHLAVGGGGEKYLLTIAEEAASHAQLTLLSPEPPDLAGWRRLGVDLEPQQFDWVAADERRATLLSRRFDLFFALHNYVPPLSLAKRSVAIVQFPGRRRRSGLRFGRMADDLRVRSYDVWLCYSRFVQIHLRDRLGIEAERIAPPVDLPEPMNEARGSEIVAVGRFFPPGEARHNKKHDVLIDAFRRLVARLGSAGGWRLHLAGGASEDEATRSYLSWLHELAEGLPIEFHVNADLRELRRLYARSLLFWHAAGFGETLPERQEHFGITTVEAMAHGCVPLVPALGGQPEIVDDGVDGFLWHTVEELVERSANLAVRPEDCIPLATRARSKAEQFSTSRFRAAVRESVL